MQNQRNISSSHESAVSLKTLFASSMRWNISGSVAFEVIKMCHHLALFAALPIAIYGQVGLTFSLVYATVSLAGFGIEAAIPPFIKSMLHSRSGYVHLTRLLLATHLPFILLGACCSLFVGTTLLPFLLILSEGTRSFLRMLLHSSFLHKRAMLTDLVATTGALAIMWSMHLLLAAPLTLTLIFGTYLVGSLAATLLMARDALRLARTLPDIEPTELPSLRRICGLRLASYVPTLARTLFSGNVLTPLLAVHFGLSTAATFKLASYVADGIRGIAKAMVRFSGGALLGRLRGQSMRTQRIAFAILGRQLGTMLGLVVLTLAIASPYIFSTTLIPAALFLLMSFIDHFDALYTQFYTVQERPALPMALKLVEVALFALVIAGVRLSSPLMLLSMLVCIKSLIFVAFIHTGKKHFGLSLRMRP